MIDRLILLAANDDPALRSVKLRVFRRFVLLHGATRSWLWFTTGAPISAETLIGAATLLTACFAMSLFRRTEAVSVRLAFPVLLVQLVATLPRTDNHFMVELLAVALLCLVGDKSRDKDEALVLAGLQWMTAIIFFHTGLQKLLHGYYLGGEFLSYMIAVGDRFAVVFRPLIPSAELARLQGLDPMATGAGPFRADSLALVAVSNAVWMAELVLPALMIHTKTRRWATWAAIAMVLGIQLGARELAFAFLFTNMLFLFLPSDFGRKAFYLLFVLYAGAAALGIFAGIDVIARGSL